MSLPLWKWCGIVETWIFRNTDEEHHAGLQRDLESGIDFTWIGSDEQRSDQYVDPARWQKNESGESLLSVHRKRKKKPDEKGGDS